MQVLQIRREVIEQNDTLLAAQATLDLRIRELELAKKAIKEAEEKLDFIVKESLKKKSLKWQYTDVKLLNYESESRLVGAIAV